MNRKITLRLRRCWKWVRPLVFLVIVLTAFRSSIADWNDVPTGSMKPSILEGDRIFVNKLAYDLKIPFTQWRIAEWSGPQRGDIVILFCPRTERRLVKRVIGLPGDVIEMRNNRLTINGSPATYEPPSSEMLDQLAALGKERHVLIETLGGRRHPVMLTPAIRGPIRTFEAIRVPDGHYFLLGDNRDQSMDSRYFGTVERRRIVGRSGVTVFSLDHDRHWLPRTDRFFKPLP